MICEQVCLDTVLCNLGWATVKRTVSLPPGCTPHPPRYSLIVLNSVPHPLAWGCGGWGGGERCELLLTAISLAQ